MEKDRAKETDEVLYKRFLDQRREEDLAILLDRHKDGLILFLNGYVHNLDDAEELMKFLPLLGCYIIFLPKEHHLTMFAVAIGAGFATFENCCYILTSGAERISYVLIRGMAVGVMHIVSIFALSVWLILAVRLKAICFPVLVAGAAISITFHALYNLLVSHTGISANIGYLMPILTAVLLYVLYRRLSETAMLKKPDVQDVQ